MKDAINDLDAALTGGEKTSSFGEEYPNAPQWAVEMAEQVRENEWRIDRKEKTMKRQEKALKDALKGSVQRVTNQVATLAHSIGAATEEEKQLLKEGRTDAGESDDLSGRQKFFIPKSELEYQQ